MLLTLHLLCRHSAQFFMCPEAGYRCPRGRLMCHKKEQSGGQRWAAHSHCRTRSGRCSSGSAAAEHEFPQAFCFFLPLQPSVPQVSRFSFMGSEWVQCSITCRRELRCCPTELGHIQRHNTQQQSGNMVEQRGHWLWPTFHLFSATLLFSEIIW